MELPIDIYDWLLEASVITEYDVKEKQPNKVILEQEATQLFEIGLKMPILLNRLQALKSLKDPETNALIHMLIPLPGFDTLKDSMTPAAKLYNWNVVTKALEVYGVKLEEEVRSLIIAGDLQIMVDMLKQVRDAELQFLGKEGETKSGEIKSGGAAGKMRASQPTGHRGKAADKAKKGAVDIANLDTNKPPEDIENCLEFLLITLSRSFNLKPKQAAGLLTDSNKYLSHILVKGLKGDFNPVTAWLMEVYAWSKIFSSLIKAEEDSNSVHMVLNAFKGGLYSKSKDVATWTLKLISKLAYDFLSLGLAKQSWEWFVSVDGGLDGTVYLLQKYTDMEPVALELYLNVGKNSVFELLTNYLKSVMKDNLSYWRMVLSFIQPLSALLPKLAEEDKTALEKVIQFWLDNACRQADNDGRHSVDERATSLNILSELWLCFPKFVESKEEVANHVLTMLKRSTRDKNVALQLFSLTHLFKLLEMFASSRNTYAPVIYKALTFSLVENHQSTLIREYVLQSFRALFSQLPSIPVSILIDPLIKQIQLSEGSTYFYNIFDFEFFGTVADNPKLGVKTGIQLLDVLAKIMLSEPTYAGLAKIPFLKIVHKMITESSVQDFLSKFVKISLSTILGKLKKRLPQKQRQPKKAQRYPNHQALLQAQAQEQSDEIMGVLECKYIADSLMDVQLLGDDTINNQMKDLVLSTHLKIKQMFKADYPPLKPLLKLYGDPDEILAEFESQSERGMLQIQYPQGAPLAIEAPPKPDSQQLRGRSVRREHKRGLKVGNRSSVAGRERQMVEGQNEDGGDAHSGSSLQLVPFNQNRAEREISQKAMLEIEKIRKSKLEREAKKQDIEAVKREKLVREKKALKQQLERRKIELGVGTRNQKDANVPILLEEGLVEKDKKKMKKILPEIQLIDFTCEEEREKNAVHLYMKKYKKLFRYLFSKYANTCYSKKVREFDALREKSEIITVAEVTKMLKDHNVSNQMLCRDELATILRLINVKMQRNDITTLTYEGFQDFFLQAAIFIYSKPPLVLSHLPLVESVQTLVKHFAEATSERGENVVLYTDPDTTALGDQDLLRELNKIVKTNPDYPVPEGYRKVTEREVRFRHALAQDVLKCVDESRAVSAELLDEILDAAVPGLHVLESVAEYEAKTKVYPDIVKPQKQLLPTRYMDAVEKKVKQKDLEPQNEVQVKKRYEEPKRSLPTNMKLLVAELPKDIRSIGQDAAAVLDEILEAVEEGRTELVKKKGSRIVNKALKEREVLEEEEKKASKDKEMKRKNRHQLLKQKIEDARKKEVEDMLKKKAEEDEKKKKDKETQEKQREEHKKEREEVKRKIKEMKEKKEEDKKKAEEEEKKKQKEEDEKKAKGREEFLKKKKEEMEKKFKEQEEKRRKEKEEEERKEKDQKIRKDKEKKKVEEQIKGDREARDAAKKVKIEFQKFLKSPEIDALLNSIYKPQLDQVFNFYAKLEDPELDQQALTSTCSIQSKSLVKFATHFGIVPDLIEQESVGTIFALVTKNRPTHGRDNVRALAFDDFLECLARMCVLGKKKLGVPMEAAAGEYDLAGVDSEVMEKFLKLLSLTPGEKKGPVSQLLKKIKAENQKGGKPKRELGSGAESKVEPKEDHHPAPEPAEKPVPEPAEKPVPEPAENPAPEPAKDPEENKDGN